MELRKGTLELIEGDALQYQPDSSFDAVLALGPGWEHDSFETLVRQTYPHALPGGLLLLADAYWRTEPTEEYMACWAWRDEMGSHSENVQVAIELGLVPLWAAAATQRDWDRYEWRYLANMERWAVEHPADPQRTSFLERARAGRDRYLAGGRDQLGFGIYLFRVPR